MDLISSIKINSVGEAEEIIKAAGTEGDLFEKARKVGNVHPNGKWVWTEYKPGKFDWRGVKGGAKGGGVAPSAANKPSTSGKTWDKLDTFNKKGSDENKLWNEWYKYQTTGDPNRISNFRNILENKFPNVASWSQTSPNTGKAIVTAKDKDGNAIAKIDLSGDTVDLPKLQEFMDKCYEGKATQSTKVTVTSLSSIKEKALKVPGVTVFEEVTSTNGEKGIKVGTKTSHTTYWYDDFKGENGALELQMDAKTLSRLERKHDENVRLSKVKSTNDFWEYLKSIGEADPKRGTAGYDIKGYIKQAKQDLINEKYLRDVTIPVVKFIVKENSKASKPKNQKEAAIADLTKDFDYRSSNLKISDYITGTRRKSGLWVTVDTAKMSTNEKKEFERIRGQLDGGKYRFEPNGVYEYWIQKKV